MTKHTVPRVTAATPIGSDVDLAQEDIRLADGSRLTAQVAARVADQARRGGGRPSLSGNAAHSPQIAFRVAPEVRARAARIASAEGKTVSQLAREALEDRLANSS